MDSSNFIKKWEKERKRGIFLYILKCTIYIVVGSYIGGIIGTYIATRSLFINLHLTFLYVIGLIFIFLVSIFIGIHLWNTNEKRYMKLRQITK